MIVSVRISWQSSVIDFNYFRKLVDCSARSLIKEQVMRFFHIWHLAPGWFPWMLILKPVSHLPSLEMHMLLKSLCSAWRKFSERQAKHFNGFCRRVTELRTKFDAATLLKLVGDQNGCQEQSLYKVTKAPFVNWIRIGNVMPLGIDSHHILSRVSNQKPDPDRYFSVEPEPNQNRTEIPAAILELNWKKI